MIDIIYQQSASSYLRHWKRNNVKKAGKQEAYFCTYHTFFPCRLTSSTVLDISALQKDKKFSEQELEVWT